VANRIKLAGTTSTSFQIGLQKVTLDTTQVSSPYTLNLPSGTGSANQILKTDGSGNLSWGVAGGNVTISPTPPSGPSDGQLWWDNVNGELYIYYTNTWVRANTGGLSTPVLLRNTAIVTTATYTATSSDWYIGVNRAGTVTITLPAGTPGQELVIKDESGACSAHPITIIGTIDNDSGGAILSINNGALHLIYRSGWRII